MPLIESYCPSPLGEVRSGMAEATSEQILSFFGDYRTMGSNYLHVTNATSSGDMVEIVRSNQYDIPIARTVIIFETEQEAFLFYSDLLECLSNEEIQAVANTPE